MNLQITEVIKTNRRRKLIVLNDGENIIDYDGKNFTKQIRTKNGQIRLYDYKKNDIPKAYNKLVVEMDHLLFSLLENDHVRVVIEK